MYRAMISFATIKVAALCNKSVVNLGFRITVLIYQNNDKISTRTLVHFCIQCLPITLFIRYLFVRYIRKVISNFFNHLIADIQFSLAGCEQLAQLMRINKSLRLLKVSNQRLDLAGLRVMQDAANALMQAGRPLRVDGV